MNKLTAQQSALFEVQKWHVECLKNLRSNRSCIENASLISKGAVKRRIRQHQKAVAAITPFLMPAGGARVPATSAKP